MKFINPTDAFDDAITAGVLSADQDAPNYADYYMYMGTDDRLGHSFKNKVTRQYIYEKGA
jgi:hypothetical protein